MKSLGRICCVIAMALLFLAASARVDVIAFYSFNDDEVKADIGAELSKFSSLNTSGADAHTFTAGTARNTHTDFRAGRAVNMTGWAGDASYYQVSLDMRGKRGLEFSYASARSGTGPDTIRLEYSADAGVTFEKLEEVPHPSTRGTQWHVFEHSLRDVQKLNNNPNVVLRIIGVGATSARGSMRLDNVKAQADASE